MGFLPLFYISLFWILIHAVHRRYHAPVSALLPSYPRPPHPSRGRITLRGVHLRIETTTFNHTHSAFSAHISRHLGIKAFLALCYDCAVYLAVFGMLVAIAGLSVLQYRLLAGLLVHKHTPSSQTIVKRMPANARIQTSSQPDFSFGLLIPGITLPLSDLPILLVACVISQAVHEAGHAVAAAVSAVPLHSIGFSLTLIFPAFFVALPSPLPIRLSPRISAAGVFHNAILVATCLFPLGTWFWPLLGFSNISQAGVAVIYADADSGIYAHLPPGTIITSLDDFSLVGGPAAWDAFFTSQENSASPGWCVDSAWASTQPSSADPSLPYVCFPTDLPDASARCFDPASMIVPGASRCPCDSTQTCISPPDDIPLLRITLDDERLVLWYGPYTEVYDEVHVSAYHRRQYTPFPSSFPETIARLVSFIANISLSLFFFNLLPLPFLDGAQLLDSILLQWTGAGRDIPASGDNELDDMESGLLGVGDLSERNRPRKSQRWSPYTKAISSVLRFLAGGQLVVLVLLGTLTWLRNRTSW